MKYILHTSYILQPLKMELIEGSETSANHNRTPGKYPKEYIQYSKHGKSLKSRIGTIVLRRLLSTKLHFVCLVNYFSVRMAYN